METLLLYVKLDGFLLTKLPSFTSEQVSELVTVVAFHLAYFDKLARGKAC